MKVLPNVFLLSDMIVVPVSVDVELIIHTSNRNTTPFRKII